jgi:hypothetical protein
MTWEELYNYTVDLNREYSIVKNLDDAYEYS